MSFKENFCSSPWFHMRINNSGSYEYCRWHSKIDQTTRIDFKNNIRNQTPIDYFQNTMAPLRQEFLNGNTPFNCSDCYIMDDLSKVSGRQKQLLKIGVQSDNFEKSMLSSPMLESFKQSYNNEGYTSRVPIDWQIDLGNFCNSACIFCNPESSSRLAAEFKQLGFIDQVPSASWCDDPVLLDKFITDLRQCENIRYLHFIGGETLITPGFKKILQSVVDANLASGITVGFTTNLTVWEDSIVDLLKYFEQVNLGLSIETLTPVNDYVRWPSKLFKTKSILDQWVELGKKLSWLIQLRITPTCLTIHDLITVYDYAWQHELSVESCNFLRDPEILRIQVLPKTQLNNIKNKLNDWVNTHQVTHTKQIINTRDPNTAFEQIVQDAQSYVNLIENSQDETFRLPELMQYLKKLESNRHNSILDYIPEYEELFRSVGY